MKTKKILSVILTLALALALIPAVPIAVRADEITIDISAVSEGASGAGWSFSGNVLTITNSANVTVTGTVSDGKRIVVAGSAMAIVTLNGVSITNPGNYNPAILLNSGANVTVILAEGTHNTLTGGIDAAGLQAPNGTTLEIKGTGSLKATSVFNGAGIGGGYGQSGGNITISGGDCHSHRRFAR